MKKANYQILLDAPNVLLIEDIGPWDEHPTVTNDAEGVVRRLASEGKLTPGKRLLYYDSDMRMDEILYHEGQFVGFAPFAHEEK